MANDYTSVELPPFNPPPPKKVLGYKDVLELMATGESMVVETDFSWEPVRAWMQQSFRTVSKATVKKLVNNGKIKRTERKRTYSVKDVYYTEIWEAKGVSDAN